MSKLIKGIPVNKLVLVGIVSAIGYYLWKKSQEKKPSGDY